MKRRVFLKSLLLPALSFVGLRSWGVEEYEFQDESKFRIWSYYVPLTSYSGILETAEGMNKLDRTVIFEKVIKVTNRISGKETDGTKNPASFSLEELQNATDYLRVKFWHDDQGEFRPSGHDLYIFKRHLEDLESGKKLFIATGMTQGHFHVVMITAA